MTYRIYYVNGSYCRENDDSSYMDYKYDFDSISYLEDDSKEKLYQQITKYVDTFVESSVKWAARSIYDYTRWKHRKELPEHGTIKFISPIIQFDEEDEGCEEKFNDHCIELFRSKIEAAIIERFADQEAARAKQEREIADKLARKQSDPEYQEYLRLEEKFRKIS